MSAQRQIRIGREGVFYICVMLAIIGGALSRQLNLLLLVGCTLIGPLVFSLIYGRLALRRLTVKRVLPPELRADQELVVDVQLTNWRRRLAIWAIEVEDSVVREDAPKDVARAGVGVFFSRIAGRETKLLSYAGQLPHRGRYVFGPLRVSTRFPLGLVRHTLVVEEPATLIVHPQLGNLAHDWAKVASENPFGNQRLQRRGLTEADYYAMRDWRSGDSRRWIHWRTSARRGALVVKQFEQRRSEDLALLVDLWQPARPAAEDLENVETAVSFAATAIADACRRGGRNLILDVAGREPLHRTGTASPFFFREQMDALAVVAAHSEATLPGSLSRALATLPATMPTLVISTRNVDWQAIEANLPARSGRATRNMLQSINVADDGLSRYFHLEQQPGAARHGGARR